MNFIENPENTCESGSRESQLSDYTGTYKVLQTVLLGQPKSYQDWDANYNIILDHHPLLTTDKKYNDTGGNSFVEENLP